MNKNTLIVSLYTVSFLFVSAGAAWSNRQDTILDEDGNEWAVIEFDPDTQAAVFDKFMASSFLGDSLDFQGRELRNAAIVDSSIEGVEHLTVESIAIRELSSPMGKKGHGSAIALVDSDGVISTTPHIRWDAQSKEFSVPALGSFSQLEIRSDVDFLSHTLKNVVLERNTELREVSVKNGVVENSILRNVTAVDLNLGDVRGDTLSINDFASPDNIGAVITVGSEGKLEAFTSMKFDKEKLSIDEEVVVSKSLQVSGETNLEGSLAVAGSVLGGGPYVDISDGRYKQNIQKLNSSKVLDGLLQLDGVSYELDTEKMTHLTIDSNASVNKERQIGFIAQDVQGLFPELVYNDDKHDFKGLHYSRFVPLLVESIKELTIELRELKELNNQCLQKLKSSQ